MSNLSTSMRDNNGLENDSTLGQDSELHGQNGGLGSYSLVSFKLHGNSTVKPGKVHNLMGCNLQVI